MKGIGGRRRNRPGLQTLAVFLVMVGSAALSFAPSGSTQIVWLGVVTAGMLVALIIG